MHGRVAFPFCGPDDVLYTRCKIDPAPHEYLNGLGFSFRTRYHFDLNEEAKPLPGLDVFKQCMFSLATEQAQDLLPVNRMLKTAAPVIQRVWFCRNRSLPYMPLTIYGKDNHRMRLCSPTPHIFYRPTQLQQKRKLTFMPLNRLIHYRTWRRLYV